MRIARVLPSRPLLQDIARKADIVRWDTHNHAVPSDMLDVLADGLPVEIDGDTITKDRVRFALTAEFTDPEAKLEGLAKLGIEAAIVSLVPALFFYDVDATRGADFARRVNAGLASFCAFDPSRLRWMAHVPMQSPELATEVLRDAHAAGAVAVQIGTTVAGTPLDGAEYDGFWAEAARLGTPVMLHPAFNAPHPGLEQWYLQNSIGNLLETTVAAERLICSGHLARFPDLRLVLVHGGGFLPWQIGRLAHTQQVRAEMAEVVGSPATWLSNVVCDTITHDPQVLSMLVERMGPERLVLGTDIPFDMATPDPVGGLDAAVPSDQARQIMEDTPTRVFGLG
ncbi:MAG TPA: amidohydrolase family protein [Gemmatimonadaceae bacterium]|nr:amidohydrolase family protein [Gemmatimonadaceae bacterium]